MSFGIVKIANPVMTINANTIISVSNLSFIHSYGFAPNAGIPLDHPVFDAVFTDRLEQIGPVDTRPIWMSPFRACDLSTSSFAYLVIHV